MLQVLLNFVEKNVIFHTWCRRRFQFGKYGGFATNHYKFIACFTQYQTVNYYFSFYKHISVYSYGFSKKKYWHSIVNSRICRRRRNLLEIMRNIFNVKITCNKSVKTSLSILMNNHTKLRYPDQLCFY